MRISDWSSDVCSSDLPSVPAKIQGILGDDFRVFGATSMDAAVSHLEREAIGVVISDTRVRDNAVVALIGTLKQHRPELVSVILTERADAGRSEERRVGKGCDSTGRSRWVP